MVVSGTINDSVLRSDREFSRRILYELQIVFLPHIDSLTFFSANEKCLERGSINKLTMRP